MARKVKSNAEKITEINYYTVYKGGYPFVNVCVVRTKDGKFHRGSAMCHSLDFDVFKARVQVYEKKIDFMMKDRGRVIAKGRALEALRTKRTYDPIVTASAHEKVFSIFGAKEAFTQERNRLWKAGYNIELTSTEVELFEKSDENN